MPNTLQQFKDKWRLIIADVVAASAQPERFNTTVLAFVRQMEATLSPTDCAAFTEFVTQETKASGERLAEAKAGYARRKKLAAQPLNILVICPLWDVVTD